MKFTFTDKKVSLPKKVHEYAEKKVGKLDRYFQTEAEASVVFRVEKGRNNVEVTVRERGTILRAAQSTSDMFVSIDAAVADMERQLRKNKARLEKRLRKDAFLRVPEEEAAFFPEEPEERQIRKNKTRLEKRLRQGAFERALDVSEVSTFAPDEPEEGEYRIVRSKTFPIKPMTVEEAVLQMNLLGHTFFAFKNEDDGGAFAVVYKRSSGGYGLIEDDG